MNTAEIAPSARSGGAMVVLFTLAAGQFLMTLDSSVMNVSIATVAKDVGTTVTGIQGAITAYTLVMAAADDHRREDRRVDRAQARVRDRLRDLRLRLVHDLDRAEPAHAPLRLVVPRGGRGRPDPSRDRRSGRRQLPDGAPAGCVRARRSRRRDCGRGRALDRRLLHDVLLVAVGVRRRGRARARDPSARAEDRRRARRAAPALRRRRRGALCARARDAGLRRAPLERVGLDPAEGGRPVVGGALADRLAVPRRFVRDLALLPLGGAAGPRVATSRSCAPACCATAS